MWNDIHIKLLKKVIDGVEEMKTRIMSPSGSKISNELYLLYRLNLQFLDHKELDVDCLNQVNQICFLLIEEFSERREFVKRRQQIYPTLIEQKVSEFSDAFQLTADNILLCMAWKEHNKAWMGHDVDHDANIQKSTILNSTSIDYVFITAIPVEFWAIIRRIDYYTGYSSSLTNVKFEKQVWVRGVMKKDNRLISVVVACSEDYGSVYSSLITEFILQDGIVPKHIFIVGICASLDNPKNATRLGLGDVGFSTNITDITLGRDIQPSTSISNEVLDWDELNDTQIHDNIKTCTQADNFSDLFLKTGLKFISKTGEDTPGNTLKIAREMDEARTWIRQIKLSPPSKPDEENNPTVVPKVCFSGALSGSRVVKQDAMRRYLQTEFPDNLILEMEGAGVSSACQNHLNFKNVPIIIKSACDFADPHKEKSWQPYCADVAATFAIALAWELHEPIQ
jgi:nucleoside phosphorylase